MIDLEDQPEDVIRHEPVSDEEGSVEYAPQNTGRDSASETENSKQTSTGRNIRETFDDFVDTQAIGNYLAAYGKFFMSTLLSPSTAFEVDNYLFGAINIGIFAILLIFASPRGFLLNLVAVALFMGVLFVVSRYVLHEKVSIADTIADFGGQLSLVNLLFLLLFIARSVDFIPSIAAVILLLIFATSFLVVLTNFIFNSRGQAKYDRYYQVFAAYIIILIALYLFFSQGLI